MAGKVYLKATDKGGVGKTGITCQSAVYNALVLNKKVLLVDIEPQGNATKMFEVTREPGKSYSSSLFESGIDYPILPGKHGVDIVPADEFLNGLDKDNALILNFVRNIRLLQERYDAIFFDVPPSGEPLLTAAYAACTDVTGILTCDYQSVQGLESFVTRMIRFKDKVNPGMVIRGFVVNLYDPRRKKQRELLDNINGIEVISKRLICKPIQNFSWLADSIDYCDPCWQKVRGETARKAALQMLEFLKKMYGSKK